VAQGLEVLDVLQLFESVEQRFLDEVIHDDSARSAVLLDRLLQALVDTRADLYGGQTHLLFPRVCDTRYQFIPDASKS
jgi:hypothetical protein